MIAVKNHQITKSI